MVLGEWNKIKEQIQTELNQPLISLDNHYRIITSYTLCTNIAMVRIICTPNVISLNLRPVLCSRVVLILLWTHNAPQKESEDDRTITRRIPPDAPLPVHPMHIGLIGINGDGNLL